MSDVKTKLIKPTNPKDEVFREPRPVTDFEFGEKVASVFDDMLDRSFYQEIQRMIAEMATDFATAGSNLYDLGCSTGNTLLNLDAAAGESVKLIGIDYGCLILVEKVLGEDSVFNRLFIKYYYDLKKRHGYNELEIAQKREALVALDGVQFRFPLESVSNLVALPDKAKARRLAMQQRSDIRAALANYEASQSALTAAYACPTPHQRRPWQTGGVHIKNHG